MSGFQDLLKSLWNAGLDPATTDRRRLRRFRLTNAVTLSLLPIALAVAIDSSQAGSTALGWGAALIVPAALANLALLRTRQSPDLCGHVAIFLLYALLLASSLAAGPRQPIAADESSLAWFYLVPLAAVLAVGLRQGWIWLVVVTLTLIGFWWPPVAAVTAADLFHRIAALLAIGILSMIFAYLSRQSEESLEAEIRIRKQAEQEARAANLAKNEILANVSHEIRTPLNGVIGTVDLMLRGELTPLQRERAEMIESSAGTLLALVDDILDFSKIEAGKLSVHPVPFGTRALFQEVVQLFRPQADVKNLEIRLAVADEIPDALHGDATRLRQVLVNLVGNAVKFTPRGRVDVSVRPAAAGRIHFAVRDTGIGISAKDQELLFAPFSQADSTSARNFGGTGLGLAISKRLVELMGGEIGFESIRGSGSTFWFELPLAPAREPPPPARRRPSAPEGAARSRSGARILVVDDNAINLRVAVQQVKVLGYRADGVESGALALEALARRPYDAVFMDCQMPGLDGYETTRRLRRQEGAGRRIPVIAVTAHNIEGEWDRCLAAGMDDFLPKPLRGSNVARTLSRWLPAVSGAERPAGSPRDRPPSRERKPVTAAAIDRRSLDSIHQLEAETGEEGLLQSTVDSYLESAPAYLESLRAAVAEEDLAAFRRAAHDLGGSSIYLGAQPLAKMCGEMLDLARQSETAADGTGADWIEFATRLDVLGRELRRAMKALQRLRFLDSGRADPGTPADGVPTDGVR